jgi:hypothetical protein
LCLGGFLPFSGEYAHDKHYKQRKPRKNHKTSSHLKVRESFLLEKIDCKTDREETEEFKIGDGGDTFNCLIRCRLQ